MDDASVVDSSVVGDGWSVVDDLSSVVVASSSVVVSSSLVLSRVSDLSSVDVSLSSVSVSWRRTHCRQRSINGPCCSGSLCGCRTCLDASES